MAITTVSSHVVSVNAIQGTLIADNAITAVHIATNAVSGTLIADNAVTATHIAQNTITVTQIADDAIEADKIADGVITTNHLNKAMISSQTEVTPVAGDFVLIGDTSDSNNLKKVPISGITALATVAGISSSADATAITIDSSENVGIGTGSPAHELDLTKTLTAINENPTLQVKNAWAGEGNNVGFDNKAIGLFSAGNGTVITKIQSSYDSGANVGLVGTQTNHAFLFNTNNSERMRIDASGRLGIGTNSPVTDIQLGNYGDASEVITFATSNNGTARLNFYDNNNTEGSYMKSVGEAYGGAITLGARWDDDEDKVVFKLLQNSASSSSRDCRVGLGTTSPNAVLSLVENKNYDPPGLGNATCHFAMLKKDSNVGGDYGIVHGIASDGHVWSQVQRVDGTATAYNQYLQPDGGSVAIGLQNNYTYLPNLTHRLHVATKRSGVGNVSTYLAKMSIEAIGYAGSNYQLGAIDFGGGDTAGAHNYYGRIGCSTMVGSNNQESGSIEFYAKAPGFSLDGEAHALQICGRVDTSSAGAGTSRNGSLFTYQGIAIDRTWANYPSLSIMNATPYSSSSSTQSELRIHGTNISSASYPTTSGSDFSVTTRSDGGYATGSDRRRKKNITTIDNALSMVKQLTGKRFQTVNSTNEVQEHVSKNGYKFGFIAQEVENIIPETVIYHEDEDDGTDNYNSAYAMDYGSVVALLVNAIKEQDTTIQDLKSRIETLEG